jgi:Flp pilus assembly pilin Flp
MFRAVHRIINQSQLFLADEHGQDMVEYSLLLLLLGCVALIYLTGIGVNISSLLSKISAKVENTSNAIN